MICFSGARWRFMFSPRCKQICNFVRVFSVQFGFQSQTWSIFYFFYLLFSNLFIFVAIAGQKSWSRKSCKEETQQIQTQTHTNEIMTKLHHSTLIIFSICLALSNAYQTKNDIVKDDLPKDRLGDDKKSEDKSKDADEKCDDECKRNALGVYIGEENITSLRGPHLDDVCDSTGFCHATDYGPQSPVVECTFLPMDFIDCEELIDHRGDEKSFKDSRLGCLKFGGQSVKGMFALVLVTLKYWHFLFFSN